MKRLAVYLLLSGVYLLYWSHVEYFADDWILMPLFRQAADHGVAGVWSFAVRVAQNRIYEVFRMQWLSILYGFAVTWLGGYSVKFNFALLLLLHVTNAWLLCQALARLGVERGLAFLAGALFLVLPPGRFVLFTYFTNPFFVFATFWVLLMLWWGPRRRAWPLAVFAVAGMFAGEQAFALLLVGIPLAAWCLTPETPRRVVARVTATVWGAVAAAGLVYLGLINRLPPPRGSRYRWGWYTLQANLSSILEQWWKLTGLPSDAPFRLAPVALDLALAAGAAVVVATLVRRWAEPDCRLRRTASFAALALVAALAPALWIFGGFALRYHYVPSPFLAVLLACACRLAGRRGAAWAGGLLAGLFTWNAASEIRQCWMAESAQHRAFQNEVVRLRNLGPGDILVVVGAPSEIGTAQHFSLHSPETAEPFVESVTGVRPVTVALGLGRREAQFALYLKRGQWKHVPDADLRRAHLLVYSQRDVFEKPEWVAHEFEPGRFRLAPLKATPDPGGVAGAVFSREQLALSGRRVYFP